MSHSDHPNGPTGDDVVLPEEDLAAYQAHVQRFFDEYQPKGNLEELLVQSLADTRWRLDRIPAIEQNLLTGGRMENAGEIDAALAQARTYRDNVRLFADLSNEEHRLARKFDQELKLLRRRQQQRRSESAG